MNSRQAWYVLLIGGPSGIGKTTVAAEVARRLGVPWLMVDDLRLALQRSGVPIPDADAVETFDGAGGLVTLGEAVAPAIEVVVENHVDQGIPIVIYAEWLSQEAVRYGLPTVDARPWESLAERILVASSLS